MYSEIISVFVEQWFDDVMALLGIGLRDTLEPEDMH